LIKKDFGKSANICFHSEGAGGFLAGVIRGFKEQATQ
jgi:hypothetical protein